MTIVSVHVDYHLIKNLFIDFFFYLSKVDRRTIIPVSQQQKKYNYTKNNLLKTVNKQIKINKKHT